MSRKYGIAEQRAAGDDDPALAPAAAGRAAVGARAPALLGREAIRRGTGARARPASPSRRRPGRPPGGTRGSERGTRSVFRSSSTTGWLRLSEARRDASSGEDILERRNRLGQVAIHRTFSFLTRSTLGSERWLRPLAKASTRRPRPAGARRASEAYPAWGQVV